jgi:hypothetical protein
MTNGHEMTPLGEAWQLGTYRRMDVLNVPAFQQPNLAGLVPDRRTRPARLHRLPTALPREIISFSDWLSGKSVGHAHQFSDIERLSLLFRYLSSPIRYEPNNLYHVHRAVPSARCIYPIDLLLTQADPDGLSRIYLYHPSFHALEALGESDARGDPAAASSVVIMGVGRFWKLVRKYGDFTPFPVMLESGMLVAQLRFLRGVLGWGGASADTALQRTLCAGDLEFPIFAEKIHQPGFNLAALPVSDVILAVQAEPAEVTSQFKWLPFLMDLFNKQGAASPRQPYRPPEMIEPDAIQHNRGFLETLRLRHSANDITGMAPCMNNEVGLLQSFAQLSRAVSSNREPLPGEERIEVVLLWPGRVAPEAGVYDRDGRMSTSLGNQDLAGILARSLPSPGMRYNLKAHSLIVLFVVDPHAESMREPTAFRDAHVAAGALAQDFCLTAAALGQFARPVRMLHEQVLESALPIKGQIIYSLLCGSSRATNVSAELL